MRSRYGSAAVFILLTGMVPSCSRPTAKDLVVEKFACDSREGVINQVGISIDSRIKKEGQGALKIVVAEPAVVRLFETGDIDIEDAVLIYQARLRTEDIQGRVYLEMWCHFEGKGEFFSRGIDATLSGTTKWTRLEIPFFLKAGENPDSLKLNLVCEGTGTVWVDDIRLIKRAI
ncbi:MAG: hypothetical protein WAU81_03625 [Candidatus Aminicenantales bacterium]